MPARSYNQTEMDAISGRVSTGSNGLPDLIEMDLTIVSIPVRLRNPDTGDVDEYELRELMGSDRDYYLNQVNKRTRLDKDGKSLGFSTFIDYQAELIHLGLYKKGTDERVSLDVIRRFPSRTQKALFEPLQKMSGLGQESDDDDDAAGND